MDRLSDEQLRATRAYRPTLAGDAWKVIDRLIDEALLRGKELAEERSRRIETVAMCEQLQTELAEERAARERLRFELETAAFNIHAIDSHPVPFARCRRAECRRRRAALEATGHGEA